MKLVDLNTTEILKDQIESYKPKVTEEEFGWVIDVKDGVIVLRGLKQAAYGEVIAFEDGTQAYIIDMYESSVAAIVLGEYLAIKLGDIAKATGKTLSMPVGDAYLGRVINPLGAAIDGKGSLKSDKLYPIEKVAPGVVTRKSVSVPLQTGIKAIDALIPIGRGQRELIIGDRGTGKTTIATDTIINQKTSGVICIYCAIGQKNSKIAQLTKLFADTGAFEYTTIVAASASESATLQYLAPYAASALAEYFMDQGKDVLVVYDDLTKHAYAYRQVSLILRRPAGREAYPGDVFYLHSRLLERACRRDEKYGGGSITALPIIETLDNDVSAYIPTNVISITDGQLFLETDLFNAGLRPAINVGVSVSRVGGAAQTKAMKQVAGKLKLDLAQYRELSAFAQFEGDLDEETKKFLHRGARLTQILKQKQGNPYDLATQVVVIWAVTKGYADQVEINDIEKFEAKLTNLLHTSGKKIVATINEKKIVDEESEKELEKLVKEVSME